MEKSNPPNTSRGSRDDDLLAGAIPIDQMRSAETDHREPSKSAQTSESEDIEPIEIEELSEADPQARERTDQRTVARRAIKASGDSRRHEEHWNRTPNTPGNGAIHVKTFVAKLRLDAIEHMDEQINQWLDSHPQYEVKFVTESVGVLKGKTDEEALFLSVWV